MKRFLYACNAIDDAVRLQRGITTDSPAASRKIFHLCRALNGSGVRSLVLSLGRGKQDGSWRYFPAEVRRVNGVATVYLPFLHAPVLSELLSLFSLPLLLWRLRARKAADAVLFYNRMPVYVPGLVLARTLRLSTVLDLEDGEIGTENASSSPQSRLLKRAFKRGFDLFCSGGAVLACSALERATRLRPTLCCYGTSEIGAEKTAAPRPPISVLLGGTITAETGAPLLIEAIRALRESPASRAAAVQFEITGKGDCLEPFRELARRDALPRVVVHGRMSDEEYRFLLDRVQVGLALKPIAGSLAHTTFPSKVIELASHGILVLSTDISDVRKVLADGALYLTEDDPRQLTDHLQWIAGHPEEAAALALRGRRRAEETCSPFEVGKALRRFLFPENS